MSVENGVRFGGGGGEARAEYRNVGLMSLIFVDDHQPARPEHHGPVWLALPPRSVCQSNGRYRGTSASLRALELRGLGGLIGPGRPMPKSDKKTWSVR